MYRNMRCALDRGQKRYVRTLPEVLEDIFEHVPRFVFGALAFSILAQFMATTD